MPKPRINWTDFQDNVINFNYEWKMKDANLYLDYLKHTGGVYSPVVPIADNLDLQIKYIYDYCNKHYLVIRIVKKNIEEDILCIIVRYRLSVFLKNQYDSTLIKRYKHYERASYSYLHHRPSFRLLPFDHVFHHLNARNVYSKELIILCEGHLEIYCKKYGFDVPKWRLSDDIAVWIDNLRHCDIILSVCGKKYPAHKYMLGVRSKVFRRKIVEECKGDVLIITDMIPEVLQEVLRYIYTGKVANLDKFCAELFAVAHKYGLGQIKAMCRKQMCSNISFENCIEIFLLAKCYPDKQLKSKCLIFMSMYIEKVMETSEWKSMRYSNPQLITEILSIIAISDGLWNNTLPRGRSETNIHTDVDIVNTQTIGVDKFNYQWAISDFNNLLNSKKNILHSPVFTIKSMPPHSDTARLKIIIFESFISIYVTFFIHTKPKPAKNRCRFSIITKANDTNHRYEKVCKFSKKEGGCKNFITKTKLLDESNGFITDDQLLLSFDVTLLWRDYYVSTKLISKKCTISKSLLQHHLYHLFKNPKLTDVTLEVAGKEFHAHKFILSARSPYFRGMFEHHMVENINSRVNIVDMREKVLEEMLLFIYTGCISNYLDLEDIVYDLLIAAEKYGLDRLRLLCVKKICEQISPENIIDIIIYADMWSIKELKSWAMQKIVRWSRKETERLEVQSLMKPNTFPLLIDEICDAIEEIYVDFWG